MIGIHLQLFSGSTPQSNLTGIKALWWDTTDAFGDATAPIGQTDLATTDANGYINLDLSTSSHLTIGEWGFLSLYKLDATDHEDSLIFSGRVQTSDITSGVDMYYYNSGWVRPTDWLPMPADAANQVCCLAMVNDTDSEYVALKAVAVGGYTVDWGDGVVENIASNVNAEHKYNYADTDLDGTLCSRGYKQAMITITPQDAVDITELYFNIRHSYYSAGIVSTPFLDMQVNAPGCTVLKTFASNVLYCRYIERWNIIALGAQTTQVDMFYNNYSCQSYDFPAGFGSVATSQSSMFFSNFSCQSYDFPAGFGSVATSQAYMFYNNHSCQSYDFPAGFGSVATSQYHMFYNNYSCQSYDFPEGFGSVATSQSSMFFSNFSCKKLTGNAAEISWSASTLLDTQALIALFTSLPTVTGGQTLTITGNPGLAGLTDANRLIATDKGWTLVE